MIYTPLSNKSDWRVEMKQSFRVLHAFVAVGVLVFFHAYIASSMFLIVDADKYVFLLVLSIPLALFSIYLVLKGFSTELMRFYSWIAWIGFAIGIFSILIAIVGHLNFWYGLLSLVVVVIFMTILMTTVLDNTEIEPTEES